MTRFQTYIVLTVFYYGCSHHVRDFMVVYRGLVSIGESALLVC